MGLIKGNGIPNRSTKGSIGDTYIDTETNKKYRCIYSLEDSLGSKEYQWEFTGELVIPELEAPTPETDIPEDKTDIPDRSNEELPRNNNQKQYNKQYNKQYRK